MPAPVTGNVTGQQPENRAFFPALDGLRWFAFTLVFLNHYISLPWAFGGVNIFFVISGFLITGILLDTEQDTHRLRNFYVRRTLRIFPVFYAFVLLLVLTAPLFHWQWSWYWLAWPLYLGNFLCLLDQRTPGIGPIRRTAANGWLHAGSVLPHPLFCVPLWSLCVEEQFYLVWPFVVYAVRKRKVLLRICIGLCIAIPLARVAVQALAPPWLLQQYILYRLTPLRVDALLLGAVIAMLWRGAHRALLGRIAAIALPILAAVSVAYVLLTLHRFTFTGLEQYVSPSWENTWGLLWIDLLAASLVIVCLNPLARYARLFQLSTVRNLGRLTYGAYIIHDTLRPQILGFVPSLARHIPNTAALLLLVAGAYALIFALAWLSFRFLETPFLRLKDRFTVPA